MFDLIPVDGITKEAWLELRRSGIGGSDAGAIMGVSKWKTPLSVYMDKIGQSEAFEENEAIYWGITLEEVVAQEFAKRTGLEVAVYPYMLRSKRYPWMLANLDRIIVGRNEGLECKTAHANKIKEWEDNKVPDDYLLQCYHYMIVTGFRKWHIACLVGGQRFIHYEIEYNEGIAESLIKAEQNFWKLVQDKTPPAAWGQDYDLLLAIHPGGDNSIIHLDEQYLKNIEEYVAASAQEKAAQERKDRSKVALCDVIGDHTAAMCCGREISWKPTTASRFDGKAFQKVHPQLHKDFCKESTTRRFLIKG